MTARSSALATAALLAVGGAAAWLGDPEPEISFVSATELWSDTLRDAGQAGLKFAPLSEKDEMEIGRKSAEAYVRSTTTVPMWEPYVNAVGHTLAKHAVRKGIQYQFHVVESPAVNAFALPGGQIFVYTGLLERIQTEMELAAVLGHEIAHVDAGHAAERLQYAKRFGAVAELAHAIVSQGYAQYQELEADAAGVRMCVEAGYNPHGAESMFRKLMGADGQDPEYLAQTPIDEIFSTIGAASDYFRTHPPTPERLRRVKGLILRYRKQHPTQAFYIGTENYRKRIAKSQQEFPGEVLRF